MRLPLLTRLLDRIRRMMMRRELDVLKSQLRSIGNGSSLELPVVIYGAENMSVGSDVHINAFVHIWAQGGLSIGDHSLIASHVALTTLTHEVGASNHGDTLISKPINIGKNVWIGSHAVILPGVDIGDNSVVGAGAVVTRSVPANTVVAGVPAKEIRSHQGI